MVKNSRICGVIVLKHEFNEKHQLKVCNMLATFSLDNDVDIVMEFSADIPDHVVLPTIALEKACMGHEFKVVEQFRDKSIVELRGVRARGVP